MTTHYLTRAEEIGLRSALSGQFQDMSTEDLDEFVSSKLSGLSEDEQENFLKSLSKIGKKALQIGKQALPGIIQGATTGSVAGPFGAIAGGLIGGATGVLAGGKSAPKAPIPSVVTPLPGIPGAIQPPPAGGSPSAARLLQLIQNPALLQALTSLILGSAGKGSIPLKDKAVKPTDFLNLLGVLSATALRETAEANLGESHAEIEDDPLESANPEYRAEALYHLLQEERSLWPDDAFGELVPDFIEGANYRIYLDGE